MAERETLRFAVEGGGDVSALLDRPANARRILAMAHGAGAGMNHPFLGKLADCFAELGTATLRLPVPVHGTAKANTGSALDSHSYGCGCGENSVAASARAADTCGR